MVSITVYIQSCQDHYIGWAGVKTTFKQKRKNLFDNSLEKLILLDSDSSATVFCVNKNITKIWNTEERMGVDANGRVN